MTDVTYSEAAMSDLHALAAMRIRMIEEEHPLPDGQKRLISENTKQFLFDEISKDTAVVWTAVFSEQLIGMGTVNFFSLPPNDWCLNGKTAYIGNLYVLPEFRRKGIASELLSRLNEEAKKRECQRILLHTTEAGRPLYEKFGFEASPSAMALYPFGIKPES
ncbi:MAG TPA: GNAT family N-acetyltransferase [Oscillospiraceae bacterium]|nr:GNAT family N-acetyltransferase [Oscillospiraceae bacterium]HPK35608.1 GNAT family N-acetyltransferase [Oscillospiraceae bacterium]HPR74672.1 GNAT family N-acetyltransferase [Oscillospiraceae bacterium]